MKRVLETVAGLALLAALAAGGDVIASRLGVAIPGAALGLLVYLLLLASGRFGWTLHGARFLVGWLGALIVAPLVVVGAQRGVLVDHAVPLALAFVAGVAVTGVATALLFRAAGGARG